MADYIFVGVKSRKILALIILTAIALFVFGIMVGYFATRNNRDDTDKPTVDDSAQSVCSYKSVTSPDVTQYIKRYVERHAMKHTCLTRPSECMDFDLPRHYIAYHMNGKTVNIDGKLDDAAWQEVPWSEPFVDIRSSVYPKPYLDTKVKLRWDDTRLYIGAYIQETNLWATMDTHDDRLHYENNFEAFMDVDGTLHSYKQLQINALGTVMDQVLLVPAFDTNDKTGNKDKGWQSKIQHAIHKDGTINRPNDSDKYWSVELAMPFTALTQFTVRPQPAPYENETWFTQFARAEFRLNVTGGNYVKPKEAIPIWWSWQPCGAVNLHNQDRWGLVQFKKDMTDTKFSSRKWHMYKALFETYTALKTYMAINSKTTNNIDELDLPPYLLSGMCVEVPKISASKYGFKISIKSKIDPGMMATITKYKYVFCNSTSSPVCL